MRRCGFVPFAFTNSTTFAGLNPVECRNMLPPRNSVRRRARPSVSMQRYRFGASVTRIEQISGRIACAMDFRSRATSMRPPGLL